MAKSGGHFGPSSQEGSSQALRCPSQLARVPWPSLPTWPEGDPQNKRTGLFLPSAS